MNEFQSNVALMARGATLPVEERGKIGDTFDILDALDHISLMLDDKYEFAKSGAKMYQGIKYNPATDVLEDLRTIYQGLGLPEQQAALNVFKHGVLYQMVMRPTIETLEGIFNQQQDVDQAFVDAKDALEQMRQYAINVNVGQVHYDDALVAKATIFAKVRAKREQERLAKPHRKRRNKKAIEEIFIQQPDDMEELVFEE